MKEYALALVIGMLIATGVCSWWGASKAKKAEVAYTTAINIAQNAKLEAERRADALDLKRGAAITLATEKYEQGRSDEKAQADRTIADLRSDVTRLRVRTNRPAGSGGVPAAPAAAGSGDGEATETLSGAVAARLAGRYADYNGLVDQLGLCQQTIEADRLQ